jgi:hypothetical protein
MFEGVWSGWRWSGCRKADGSPQIEDRGETIEVCEVVAEVAVSHAGAAIETFEVSEHPLDGRSPWSDQGITSFLPVWQAVLVLV